MKTILLKIFFLLFTSTLWSQADSCTYGIINFPNGKVKEEGCVKNDKREGVWKQYEEEGYLRFIWTYKDGLKDGPYKALHSNGVPEAIGQWKQGHIVDTLKYFNETGEIVKIEFWVADKLAGSSHTTYRKTFNKNAKPDGTIEKIDGKDFLWMNGEKHELHYDKKSSDSKKTKPK